MTWGLFIPQFPEDHVKALHALSSGLTERGIPHFRAGLEYRDCDVAVVFGIGKTAVPASWPRGEIIRHHQARGKRALIVEKGFVKRDEYFHIGWDGLNGRADFCNEDMPPDRWDKLDVKLANWQVDQPERPVIVCGQVPWDASVQHSDHIVWCQETLAMLRAITGRHLVFRPHPAVAGRIDYGVPGVQVSDEPLEEVLANAHAVVTFNSNTAVDAVIRGVPVFVADQGSMVKQVANWELSDIERPVKPPRQQWAADLAYTQWNLAEMARGEPIEHLTARRVRMTTRGTDHGEAKQRLS